MTRSSLVRQRTAARQIDAVLAHKLVERRLHDALDVEVELAETAGSPSRR
jgi:hypothetical protein